MRAFVAGSVLLHAAALGVWQLPPPATPAGAPVLRLSLAVPDPPAAITTAAAPAPQPAPAGTGLPQAQARPADREPAAKRNSAARPPRPAPALPPPAVTAQDPPLQATAPAPSAERRAERLSQLRARLEQTLNAQVSYPLLARKRGWEGTVRLALHIDGQGRVVAAEVSESSGHRVLDRAALEGLARARLVLDDGWPAPGDFDMVVPVTFRLVEDRLASKQVASSE